MYILREHVQNEVDDQKISGVYHLTSAGMAVSLRYYHMNTDAPQARLNINGLDMETQDYEPAKAEFQQIVDAASAECDAAGASFVNLSDITVKAQKKAAAPAKAAPAKAAPQKAEAKS